MRSARMTSEPCVSTTFPSKIAVFFASSAVMLSDSMLTGLSRSARSASAGAHASIESTISAAARRLLPRRNIERAPHLGLQRELLLVLVDDQPDARQSRLPVGKRHRLVRSQDSLSGEHVKVFRACAQLGLVGGRLAQDEHVAVQIGFFPLAI